MTNSQQANRLINSTSPYLLQHAYNPVDWYEWGEEALMRARRENKPILVSIGYSSCHWCHVMEHEVFEKTDIARVMNATMVCIKVDREERPDIDSVYMDAVQTMGINGGWPLNVFLTPEQKPFYGGTYFPADQWVNVINAIGNAFRERRDEIEKSAEELTRAISQQDTARFKKVYEFTSLRTELDKSYAKLAKTFDLKWGGFDRAPKFVMPSVWLWLLRYHYVTKNPEALNHLKLTLDKIAFGGIYDQLGGGFARYSVDGYWFVPHFEKMLYDNAQLISLYAEAYAATGAIQYKTVVEETFEWLEAEMMHPEGGFFSALDADSEGVEGKFYIWQKSEIEDILKADADIFCDYFNVQEKGNWEHGENILIRTQPDDVFLLKHKLTAEQWSEKLRALKDKLLEKRDQRIHPGLDDKIITSWNAMMVAGLVDAYTFIRDERFLKAAVRAMTFLEKNLIEDGVVYRSFKNKRSVTTGFLDDYAYVIAAYLSLYQATFDEEMLQKARALTEKVIREFHDQDDGFFFFSSSQNEQLIARKKEIFDNVIPSSNSVMAQNLYRLGCFLDHTEFKTLAESMVTPITHLIVEEPNYMSNWGIAYLEMKHGLAEVVVAGDVHDARTLSHRYAPLRLTMLAATGSMIPLTEGKSRGDQSLTVFVCKDKTCLKPVHTLEEAWNEIESLTGQ